MGIKDLEHLSEEEEDLEEQHVEMVSKLKFNSWLQEIGVGIYDILDADAD